MMVVSLYVDDSLTAGNSNSLVIDVMNALCARFEMEDYGEARLCLGIENSRIRSSRTLNISQNSYPVNILS